MIDMIKKYDIVYSDPPWNQKKGGVRSVRPNQTKQLDYKTMNIDDIFKQHQQIPVSDQHVVFMWTIDKYLHECEKYMISLGYKLHARIIWDKGNGIAPAFTIRYSHEYLLWFYKDKLLPIAKEYRGKYKTVIVEKSTKHSKKPTAVYEMIENLYPSYNKLEMYARNKRCGWDVYGNEIESSIQLNIDD